MVVLWQWYIVDINHKHIVVAMIKISPDTIGNFDCNDLSFLCNTICIAGGNSTLMNLSCNNSVEKFENLRALGSMTGTIDVWVTAERSTTSHVHQSQTMVYWEQKWGIIFDNLHDSHTRLMTDHGMRMRSVNAKRITRICVEFWYYRFSLFLYFELNVTHQECICQRRDQLDHRINMWNFARCMT